MMGYKLTKTADAAKANTYLGCIYTTADYFLGCNPLNTTWVTGLGIRQPHRLFHMDSWYNGKGEMAPGMTPYGPWRVESYSTGQGAWDMKWAHKSIYPAEISSWPGHERWFGNSTCPMNAEFTIHQNTVFNAAIFGFLCSTASVDFVPNKRPVVSLTQPSSELLQHTEVPLAVNVTDPDGTEDIYKVEYFHKWHKIGESYKAPYSLTFNNIYSGQLKLSARVTDKSGLVGRSDTLLIYSKPNKVESVNRKTALFHAYPNPFNSEVTFEYDLKTDNNVAIEIFDLSGKKISVVHQGYQKAGRHQIKWNSCPVGKMAGDSGMLLCRYTTSETEDGQIYLKLI
ncbi:MAG: T9SS type A sorting domain-containing protein [Bacteroidales bacterium]|nr:T9SS type A sorting domain-containing protein [Bacteroidales bacterium]